MNSASRQRTFWRQKELNSLPRQETVLETGQAKRRRGRKRLTVRQDREFSYRQEELNSLPGQETVLETGQAEQCTKTGDFLRDKKG